MPTTAGTRPALGSRAEGPTDAHMPSRTGVAVKHAQSSPDVRGDVVRVRDEDDHLEVYLTDRARVARQIR